jgi:hypothetical protein
MAKSIDEKRRASVESMLARHELCAHALQEITLQQEPISRALRPWAIALGRGAAFDKLKPVDVGQLLAKALKAAEGIGHHLVEMDHAMADALEAVKRR